MEYSQEPAISKSGLDLIDKSPLDFWWHRFRPECPEYVPDEKEDFETAFRCAVLTPNIFSQKYVNMPKLDRRKPNEKSEYERLMETTSAKGQVLLGFDSNGVSIYKTIKAMQNAVQDHPTANFIFKNGAVGMPSRFIESESGATVKFIAHWISENAVINLMSTSDAGEENFAKEAWNMKLHRKAAIQMDGTGKPAFVFVNVERKAPHKIGIRYLDQKSIDLGRETYIKNCYTFVECLESGVWPGLPEKIVSSSLPDWAFKE